jgi:Tfp pilus tip-associated adhesin PilY1
MNFVKAKSRSLALTMSFFGALLSYPVMADDTEIFFSESVSSVNPNVMFVVDVSGSMDEEVTGSGGQSRLTVMQNALRTVLKSAPDNLNVGLMNYGEIKYHDEGHGVKFPITDITAFAEPVVSEKLETNEWGYTEWWNSSIPKTDPTTTVRSYLSEITNWYWKDNWYKEVVDNNTATEMDHVGVTPIVDALYEAAMYFRGEDVSFGLGSIGYWNRWAAHQSTYEGEPVIWQEELCESSYVRTHNDPIDFANGEQPWYRCPADSANPQSPGTYENCQSNEICTTETETNCKEWVNSYCTEEVVDEGGANNCAEGKRVAGYCKNEDYETITVQKCKYNICEGGYSSKPKYRTPIKQACQSNFIVLLSDGKPQYSYDFDDEGNRDGTNSPPPTFEKLESGEFPAMVDFVDSSNRFDHSSCASNKTPNGYRSGACGPEMTAFLSKADNSNLEGVQTIDTYAIGFGLDGEASAQDYLKSLVSTDDPATPEIEGYFSAEDENQLSRAFSNILAKISTTTTSFASPGYSVDLKTGLFNEEDIYIPVFDKSLSPRWSGNLKKFKLATDANGKSSVVDKYGNVAVDNLGVFTEETVDIWSKSTSGDGRDVSKGGVAQLIDPNNRKAYTDIACSGNECEFLTIAKNRIHPENDISSGSGAITNEVLGLDEDETSATRINMLNFIRGRKWNSETGVYDLSPHMGDMLHTEPLIVTYDKNYKDGATPNGQVIYATTNEGYLHAFDTVTGKEIFAFMPSSLMKNIPTQYYNSSIGEHAYGIDGIMSKRVERDKDGSITKVLLYFGLRRGGREYYALDVTKPDNPKLLWKIDALAQEAIDDKKSCKKSAKSRKSEKTECTIDGTLGKGDFAKLGQSWSTPYLAKIRTSDKGFKDVVIFSGGYDVNQDEYQSDRNDTDTVGNEIFIVDAGNGNLIWSANNSALKHSIPGGMRILDLNQDGAIDRMYFADTGGNVWRLELPMGPSYELSGAKLIKFAELGGKGSDNRMFFNEPDVALLKSKGVNWLTIAVGSGYRAHPADNVVDDNFYVLLDNAVNTPLTEKIDKSGDFKTLEPGDLEVITISDITGAPSINRGGIGDKTILDLKKAGWYLEMPSTGEKVLAPSITSEGSVMFTTLVPPDSGADLSGRDLCEAPITQGRFYSFNILTAEAGSDVNNSGTVTDIDVMTVVTANEIPGSPQRIFNKPTCKGMECTQLVDIRVGKRSEALTTYDASLLESVFWTNPNRK